MYRSTVFIAALLLSGCTVNKTPVPVKSNENAGVVRLGFDKSPLQNAKVDTFVALSAASHQCQQWGYVSALPYGEPIKTCSVTSGALCLSQHVTMEYQCQGVGMEKYVREEIVVE
ncbi:YecR-like lipofamily protein [Enterobacteriaceae bacterium H11S18]|uniref:YecR family lipoprotein n=1 Tax=Dryocola clanedunensis TaxID=2925396 RepID=UPI0022F08889|nr:YecR family lipoprotein [Dryocola clanedunensis]MCT4706019.1 YecR-like lipofamily protein [Dryocola clanedunensis]MCT4710587.1 YecR-like lipofamily protein [Dryocola clanedunensis]